MKNLFVGNMNFQTTETELRSLFEPFGQLARVRVVTDRETGRARGFAFVEMVNDGEAVKAITALNGKEVGGRALNVNEARPKTESSAPRRDSGDRDNGNRAGAGGYSRGGGFARDDYSGSARQPREPRW
jgi:cold-inducible RNA-binding protein